MLDKRTTGHDFYYDFECFESHHGCVQKARWRVDFAFLSARLENAEDKVHIESITFD